MEEEFVAEAAEIPIVRPDWLFPASIVFDTAAHVTAAVASGFLTAARLMVSWSEYRDDRLAFHEAAATEMEKLTEGEVA